MEQGKEPHHNFALVVRNMSSLRILPTLDDPSHQHYKQSEQEFRARLRQVNENKPECHPVKRRVDFLPSARRGRPSHVAPSEHIPDGLSFRLSTD
jgi:hypothetical protein